MEICISAPERERERETWHMRETNREEGKAGSHEGL